MPLTPTSILWTRGQDLLVLAASWGQVNPATGVVGFAGFNYSQNKGTGPGTITFPAGNVTLSQSSIRGNCDGFRIASRYMLDQIIALDANTDNFTEILLSSDVSIGEVMKQSGNILPYGFYNRPDVNGQTATPYIQIAAAVGNVSHYRGYLMTMQREGLTDGVTNFGKNTIELMVKPADLGWPCVQYFESP